MKILFIGGSKHGEKELFMDYNPQTIRFISYAYYDSNKKEKRKVKVENYNLKVKEDKYYYAHSGFNDEEAYEEYEKYVRG